jgi:Flp pilus assembly protein TadB
MDPHVVNLDAQHCLAIAAAFIAIIGACASLIGGANSKAESLTSRIHEAAGEYRAGKLLGNSARCAKLKEQIHYYDARYLKVQRAQRLLFLTIGIFIICLTVFIGLALYGVYSHTPDVTVYPIARYLVAGIGVGVTAGTLSMLQAIRFHYQEVWQSYETLNIEMSDCRHAAEVESPADEPHSIIDAGAAELLGSRG